MELKQNFYKSCMTGILISLGVYLLLITNYAIYASFLFAFALFTICTFGLNLFTGQCYSFFKQDKQYKRYLGFMLCVNLITAYIFGWIGSYIYPETLTLAIEKVSYWSAGGMAFSIVSHFIKAFFCGVIMFIAVAAYKKGSPIAIFFGIPIFIICGFQHCIANAALMGFSRSFSFMILIAIVGNLLGSVVAFQLCYDERREDFTLL